MSALAELPLALANRSVLFAGFSDARKRSIAREMVPMVIPAGQIIIRQGDVGDGLYILATGAARVSVARTPDDIGCDPSDPERSIPLALLGPGDHFGEQALLQRQPTLRTASIQSLEECLLYKVPIAVFQKLLEFDDKLVHLVREQGQEYVLNQLRQRTRHLQSAVFDVSSLTSDRRRYLHREILFRQGAVSEHSFFLLSGTVVIKFHDDTGRFTSRVELSPPRLFGEVSVLGDGQRTGTAVARGEVEVIAVPASEIRALHHASAGFRELCRSLENIYDVAGVGRVMQYRGSFMDMAAYCLLIQRSDGTEFASYSVIDSDVFAITRTQVEAPVTVRHEDGERARELTLDGDRLVGATCHGRWPDSRALVELVMQQPVMTTGELDAFRARGMLPGSTPTAPASILCRCMQVPESRVDELIAAGHGELTDIMTHCGAGTVCGGCRPVIKQKLGYRGWTTCRLQVPVEHCPDIWSFRLVPVRGPIETFRPGQHIVVRAKVQGQWVIRSYTLTSTPGDPYYEITVKREPRGLFSGWLFERAHEQPRLQVSSPQGEFCVDPAGDAPILFFAGGIGITPALGFLRAACLSDDVRARVLLDISVRTEDRLILSEVIERAQASLRDFRCRRRVTSVDGRITRENLVGVLREYSDPRIYICGPRSFELGLTGLLAAAGVPESSIFVEQFTPVSRAGRLEPMS